MFKNRQHAGRELARAMRSVALTDPLVLAIPRGGVEIAAPLAEALGAELDVVLSRKLRAPEQPELAIGAVSEDGEVYLEPQFSRIVDAGYIEHERRQQLAEIARRAALFRTARPQAPVADRSVIVTDDGIATGSTMMAALHTIRAQRPRELIVAVPVAPPERLAAVKKRADRVVCLMSPEDFFAVGQFYEHFEQVEDERVVEMLSQFRRRHVTPAAAAHTASDQA